MILFCASYRLINSVSRETMRLPQKAQSETSAQPHEHDLKI